jgi:hypothetical protein
MGGERGPTRTVSKRRRGDREEKYLNCVVSPHAISHMSAPQIVIILPPKLTSTLRLGLSILFLICIRIPIDHELWSMYTSYLSLPNLNSVLHVEVASFHSISSERHATGPAGSFFKEISRHALNVELETEAEQFTLKTGRSHLSSSFV